MKSDERTPTGLSRCALGLIVMALTGCGALKGKAAANAAATAPPPPAITAKQLGLEVRTDGGDANYPGEDERSIVLGVDEQLGETEVVTFKKNVILPIPNEARLSMRPLFFVWSENALGSPIQSAFFSVRLRDETNRVAGEPEPTAATYDPKSSRWFIPFSRLFKEGEAFDPSDEYTLQLDLNLANKTSAHLFFNFHVLGKLPAVTFKVIPQMVFDDGSLFEYGGDERTVETDEITNTSRYHPLSLWISSATKQIVQTSYLKRSQIDIFNKVIGESLHASTASFALNGVGVLRLGHAERMDLEEGRWIRLSLAPGETLLLEWYARPTSDTVHCRLPADALEDPRLPKFLTPLIHWSRVGVDFSARYSRILKVTDPVTSPLRLDVGPEEVARELTPRILTLATGETTFEEKGGQRAPVQSDFPGCQGLF